MGGMAKMERTTMEDTTPMRYRVTTTILMACRKRTDMDMPMMGVRVNKTFGMI